MQASFPIGFHRDTTSRMEGNEGWRLPQTVPWKKRLVCWLGIYLAAQLPLVMLWPFFFNYPWGLDPYLALNIPTPQEPRFRTIGYFVYLLHFALTMAMPSRGAFRFLMIVLIILVTLNTASCMRTTWPEWLHGLPKIEG